MTTALASIEYRPTEISTERLGDIMVRSGFFKDLKDEAQAIVKILYGRELGVGPMASVLGVYIVEGRPSLSAQLIASVIQRSQRFRYRVREWTSTACRIEFFEGAESLGESGFTIAEAATAGLAKKQVWTSYPKAMLWARAMSQGARAFTPEVFSGPIYTPEELGAVVNEAGQIIDGETGEVIEQQTPRDVALEEWVVASDEATRLGIPHKELPQGAGTAEQIERWTTALHKKIAEHAEPVVA